MEHDGLTLKQRTLAYEYVAMKGNATKAAIAAGYAPTSAHVQAHRTLRIDKVARKVRELTLHHEITAERVVRRLDNLSKAAQSDGQHGAAVKAEELIGKSLGMWIDRSVSVNVDLTTEHLAALQALVGIASPNTIDATAVRQDVGDDGGRLGDSGAK